MRIRVARDGRTDEVEVAPDLRSVTLDGHTFPVVIVRSEALRVELEIGGEKVMVENWPDHFPDPPAPVDVNGERASVQVERRGGGGGVAPARPSAPLPVASGAAAPPPPMTTTGTAILPPMPGKILEVRVHDGERVAAGHVVVVLEAMKMRNEVITPVAGVVRNLRVSVGANVRAREPMLSVEPA